ncbi:hypothetical protein [Kitasatospora griseola]
MACKLDALAMVTVNLYFENLQLKKKLGRRGSVAILDGGRPT